MKPLYRPREGVCSRGWLFMGEQGGPCDRACEMCYYAHQKNLVFYSLETLLQHANLFRHYYGLDACDISGGEATIYKPIVELVAHCASIGLRPTIISHGQNLHDGWKLGRKEPLYKEIEAAGLDDWLISLHGGTPESHDKVLCREGSFKALVGNLDNLEKPVRFNTTLLLDNYQDLPVNILADRPPTVWNPIMFNPFHAWSHRDGPKDIDFQVEYRVAAPHLARAIEKLEALGWEVNVRYWPFCIAEEFGFAENVSGYHQVPFDPWEWRLNVTARTPLQVISQHGGWYDAERALAVASMQRRENEVCSECTWRNVCDRPPEQYQRKYGLAELRPQNGSVMEEDPLRWQKARGLVCAQ